MLLLSRASARMTKHYRMHKNISVVSVGCTVMTDQITQKYLCKNVSVIRNIKNSLQYRTITSQLWMGKSKYWTRKGAKTYLRIWICLFPLGYICNIVLAIGWTSNMPQHSGTMNYISACFWRLNINPYNRYDCFSMWHYASHGNYTEKWQSVDVDKTKNGHILTVSRVEFAQ